MNSDQINEIWKMLTKIKDDGIRIEICLIHKNYVLAAERAETMTTHALQLETYLKSINE